MKMIKPPRNYASNKKNLAKAVHVNCTRNDIARVREIINEIYGRSSEPSQMTYGEFLDSSHVS